VDKRKRNASKRAVERATKRQCKKDERQTKALLARMRNWTAHMFDVKGAISVTCKVALVEECLQDARAVAKSAGEKLPWLECLPKGIRELERLAAHLKRWGECWAKAGEFMVVREAEHENEISTDNEDDSGGVIKKLGRNAQAVAAAEQQAHCGVGGVIIAKREGDARGSAPAPVLLLCCGME
jgi:hypothetical protein